MRLESAFRVLFFVYCLEAGLLLAVLPWTASWERFAVGIAVPELARLAASGAARGALCGFGLVHLVWALHDLDGFVRRLHLP